MLGALKNVVSDAVSGVTDTLGITSSGSKSETAASDSEFAKVFNRLVTPDDGNNVNEEELFAVLARQRIAELKGDEAASAYDQALEQAKVSVRKSNGFVSMEEAGIAALKQLRSAGTLSSEEADQVYSSAFDAAQLDSNKDKLFDSRGGPGDATIAVATMESALMNAKLLLDKISSGGVAASARLLDQAAPNSGTSNSSFKSLTTAGDPSAVAESNQPSGTTFDGANGFLFKPVSSADGKLAVLMPEALAYQVESLVLKGLDGETLEEGRSTGYGDLGTREKYAFSKPGGDYPDGVVVEARLSDGSVKSWKIPDPAQRYD